MIRAKHILAIIISCTLSLYGQLDSLIAKTDSVWSQSKDTLHQTDLSFDTTYIRSYPDYLSIALFLRAPSINIQINRKHSDARVNDLMSNVMGIIGLDLDYKGISVVGGLKGKNDINSQNQKGKSNYRYLALKIHRHKIFLSASYTRCEGFYDQITYLKFPESSPDRPYMLRPSLNYLQANVSFLYNINHQRYSYLAPFAYTERQMRSKGGWLLAGGFYYNNIKDQQPIIQHLNPSLGTSDTLNKELDAYILKLGFGRGFNVIVFKRIFFNLQAIAYGNLAYINTHGNTKDRPSLSPNIFAEVSAGLGYNTERFFIGFRVLADRNAMRRNEYRYLNSNRFAQLNIGYRFNSPKWLNRSYDAIITRIKKL